MAAQINRNVSHTDNGGMREPELSDFKETGVLEENTDVAILLYWPDRESPEYIMNVAKNRDGRTGRIPCLFRGKFCTIEENSIMIEEIQRKRREAADGKQKTTARDRGSRD